MPQTPDTPSPDTPGDAPGVEVEVARTGGIAGITRRWSAKPLEAEASDWIALIDRCPWDEVGGGAAADGADSTGVGDAPEASPPSAGGRETPPPVRPASPVPDGFVWWIRASWSATDAREAELPDQDVVGAWRELVDAVRDWSRQSSASSRTRT